MSNRLTVVAALLLEFAVAGFGQAPPAPAGTAKGPLNLTLQQAVDMALAPDGATRLKLAAEFVRQSDAQRRVARADLLPNLDGRVDYQSFTRNLEAFGIGSLGPLPISIPRFAGPFSVLDARASVSQTVFDLSAIRRYQAAKAGVEAARAQQESTQNDTIENVARAYLDGLKAQAQVETAQANVDLGQRLLALAESEKRAGTGTGIEITRAQSVLANDRQAHEVAQFQFRAALLRLKRLIGLEMDIPLQLASRMEYTPEAETEASQALATARNLRADWKAQQKRLERARLAYSASKWTRLPSIRAYGDYGSIGIPDQGMLPTRTVGIQMQVPLWNGGRREAQRAESLSQLQQEEIKEKDLLDQIELEVRTSLDELQSADAQVQAANEGLQLAQQELEHAQRRYQAGVTTTVEVTDAQARLERARSNRVDALYAHNLARIDVASSVGRVKEIVH